MGKKVALVSCVNRKYVDQLARMSYSVKEAGMKVDPIFTVVNTKRPPKIYGHVIHRKINFARRRDCNRYCCHIKPWLMAKVIEERTHDVVVWLDADSYVNKNPDHVLAPLYEYDFCCKQKPGGGGRLMTPMLIAKCTNEMMLFLRVYYDVIKVYEREGGHPWFADQQGILAIINTFIDIGKMRFSDIPREILDVKIKNGSYIWNASGPNGRALLKKK